MGAVASIQAGNPILLYGRHLTRQSSYEMADVLLELHLFNVLSQNV